MNYWKIMMVLLPILVVAIFALVVMSAPETTSHPAVQVPAQQQQPAQPAKRPQFNFN